MKKLIFIVLFFMLPCMVKSQNYSCVFLDLIIRESLKRGANFSVFSSVMKSKIDERKHRLTTIERLDLADVIRDSLRKCCGHSGFFDDSLFHLKGDILLIDTFNFFNASCPANLVHGVTVVNRLLDFSCMSKSYDVISVQSIRAYRNRFIITLKHYKNEEAVDFKFDLIANHLPILSEVERWYLE